MLIFSYLKNTKIYIEHFFNFFIIISNIRIKTYDLDSKVEPPVNHKQN